jgi:uncharacterized protein
VSSIDNLKKEAKRWLKAIRADDAEARARLQRAYPKAPDTPGLRDIQHALAREHGVESWQAFTATIGAGQPERAPAAVTPELVRTFLESACWDHHTHGKGDHRMYDRAAQRFLAQHPSLAGHDLYTAIVCGEIDQVRSTIAGRPEVAREPGGARGWTPILYAAYTRFTHPKTIANAVEIARLLLDAGANPNDFYMAGDSEYTCLVGAAGEGEQDSPRQPYAEALYSLFLERGARPYDIQVLYNTHFSGDMLWWLQLTYEHSVKTGHKSDWDDPNWPMFDMGGYGSGASFVLRVALDHENLALAEWALTRGASPNFEPGANPRFKPDRTPYDEARLRGLDAFADLLQRHGARSEGKPLDDDQAFLAACMRLDRAAARALVEKHPEYLRSHHVMFHAAKHDRPDVIELLLDLGVPLEISDAHNTRALHHAGVRAAKFLIDRGAEVDPRETNWGAVPIGWASHGDDTAKLDLLSRYSRNIWTLAFRGYVDRVREILRDDPSLAKQMTSEGITPLWWLPDDDAKAMAIVNLLLDAGADPSARNHEGRTAADWARQRAMTEVADRLVAAGAPAKAAPPETTMDLNDRARFDALANDLVVAYDSGNPDAIRRLTRHYGGDVTWAQLRTAVRARLQEIGRWGPQEPYFALPQARELVARECGYADWAALERGFASGVRKDGMFPATEPIVLPPAEPADVPIEMRAAGFIQRLRDNTGVPTAEVWNLLMACRDGDRTRVEELLTAWPTAVRSAYNYMPPLHLAVREGHLAIVRDLAARGAVNPKYRTYPYNEPLTVVAADRGYAEIATVLEEAGRSADPDRPDDEAGHIEYRTDFERQRFSRLVGANDLREVEAMLQRRPELAIDPFAFNSEGILSMPANRRHLQMIDLLMQHGARVPVMTKWGAEYYFKHDDIAGMFLERGMSAAHRNCHRTTLLHEMARRGALTRARLLLDHGADIDAVDEEFRSTPLGFAARWGQREMVRLLLDRGADRTRAGAEWAVPAAWARLKGHREIAADLA